MSHAARPCRARAARAVRAVWLAAAALGASLLLAGCQLAPQQPAPPPPPADTPANDRDLAAAVLMADTFQTMQRLTQAAPAEQAEIVSAARDAFQRSPRGDMQLRYALLLATPGHPARDVNMAQMLLRELAAQPEALVPIERAVVLVELSELDREIDLTTDNQQLQAAALRNDQQRSAADQRRLQAQIDENARLRRGLEAAQAKLDAVATIERNLTERRTGTEIGPEPAAGAGAAPGAGSAAGQAGSSTGAAGAPAAGAGGGTSSGPVTRPAAPAPGSGTGSSSGSGGSGAGGSGSTGSGGGGTSGGSNGAGSNGSTGP
jgi:hypothetical protein